MNTPLSDFSFERVGPGGQAMIFPIPLGKEFVNEIFFGVDFFIYTNQFTVLIEHSPTPVYINNRLVHLPGPVQVNDIISFNCDSASALENSNQFAFYLRKNSASLPPNVLATLTKGIHYFFEHADTRDMIAQVLNRFEFDDNIGPLRALYESILLEEKMPVPPIDLDNRQSEGNLQTLESYEMKVQELAEKNVQMEKKEALQRRLLLERPAQAAKFSDAMRSWVLERSDGGEEFPVICLEIGESYEVGELVMRMFRVNAWVTSKKFTGKVLINGSPLIKCTHIGHNDIITFLLSESVYYYQLRMYASERSQKFVTLLYRQLSLFGDSDDVLLEVQKICQRNLKYSSYCTVNNLLQKKLKLRNESGILELLHETAANPFTVREIKDWKAFADEFPTAKESATDSQELVKPQNSEILVVELSKEAFKSLVIGEASRHMGHKRSMTLSKYDPKMPRINEA